MKIETLEQLEAVPQGSVVRGGAPQEVFVKGARCWWAVGTARGVIEERMNLPVTRLIPAMISQEQLAEMVAAFWSLETAPTPEAGMANALTVIGVSVDAN